MSYVDYSSGFPMVKYTPEELASAQAIMSAVPQSGDPNAVSNSLTTPIVNSVNAGGISASTPGSDAPMSVNSLISQPTQTSPYSIDLSTVQNYNGPQAATQLVNSNRDSGIIGGVGGYWVPVDNPGAYADVTLSPISGLDQSKYFPVTSTRYQWVSNGGLRDVGALQNAGYNWDASKGFMEDTGDWFSHNIKPWMPYVFGATVGAIGGAALGPVLGSLGTAGGEAAGTAAGTAAGSTAGAAAGSSLGGAVAGGALGSAAGTWAQDPNNFDFGKIGTAALLGGIGGGLGYAASGLTNSISQYLTENGVNSTLANSIANGAVRSGINATQAGMTGGDIGAAALSGGVGGALSPVTSAMQDYINSALNDAGLNNIVSSGLAGGIANATAGSIYGAVTGRDVGQGAINGAINGGANAIGNAIDTQYGTDGSPYLPTTGQTVSDLLKFGGNVANGADVNSQLIKLGLSEINPAINTLLGTDINTNKFYPYLNNLFADSASPVTGSNISIASAPGSVSSTISPSKAAIQKLQALKAQGINKQNLGGVRPSFMTNQGELNTYKINNL